MIPIRWTAHIANSPEEKESFERTVRTSTTVFDRLVQIIKEKEAAIDRIDYQPSTYEDAGWAYKQAHLNGRRAELAEIKQLLTIE